MEDNEKLKKQKKSRLEKRLVMKEQKKRRRLESQTTSLSETNEVCDNEEDELDCESISSVTDQVVVKETENNEITANDASKRVESNLSVSAKPFFAKKDGEIVKENAKATYIWKKDSEPAQENEKEKASKAKERKTKERKKPVALSLEEFRQKIQDFSYYNECKVRLHNLQQNKNVVEDKPPQWSTACESEKVSHLDQNQPFHIPEDLRDNPVLETAVQSCNSIGSAGYSKVLKEKAYMHLETILGFYGPMRVDDPALLEEVSTLDPVFQQMIADAGGLKDFLMASIRFAFVGDHICTISDVLKAYSLGSEPYNHNGYSNASCDRIDEYDELLNGVVGTDNSCRENNKFQSRLNPDANEYSPIQSNSSITPGNSYSSSETYEVNVKEMEQESIIDNKSLNKLKEPLLCNGPSFSGLTKRNSEICDELLKPSVNAKSEIPADSSFFFSFKKEFEHFAEGIRKLPDDLKFDMILKVLKFVLNDEYYAENISLFNQHLKPFTFTLLPKRQNKCLQAGTPDIEMHSKAVMKEDEHVKALIENFHDLEQYRNKLDEEKKIVEEKLEHSLDTIVQVQNALAVAERDQEKRIEEIQALLEEEKKESKKKEKNWEKEQKRFELNQAKMSEQLKSFKEEIKNLKEELAKKDAHVKEVEDLKRATEIDLENESKAKKELEASLHDALQSHEIQESTSTTKVQTAQLEVLNIRKKTVVDKILVATKNAELRLKEIQDGLPMVSSHPLFLDKMKSLQSQIKQHIIRLGKIHSDYMKAADEQINKLKNGEDLNSLPPLAEPILSECPVLIKAPSNLAPAMAPNSINLTAGNPSAQAHPNIGGWNSFGLMQQTPNSSSVQPTAGATCNPLFEAFAQNPKLTAPQNAGLQGTAVLGNLPGFSGSNIPSVSPYPVQNFNVMNSSNLLDSSLYPNATSSYLPKTASSFQPNLPRPHVPPGLSVRVQPSAQDLPSGLPQTSNMFNPPQTVQQNTPAIQPVLQTPFSFGFPQFDHKAAVTQLNVSDKTETLKRSAAEVAVEKVETKTENKPALHSETHNEKSVSKENISEAKSHISNSASLLDSVSHPEEEASQANSMCSSPIPMKSSRSDSFNSASIHTPEPPPISKQVPTFSDIEATGVKPEQPIASTKQKADGSCRSGASSVISDYDSLHLDNSVPEGSMLELGYTVKELAGASKTKCVQPSASSGSFAKAAKATTVPPKNIPLTNSYEKLLQKLSDTFPQYSRTELMACVGEFRRNNNNKLSNLKFGNIISGIGKILEKRRNNLTQAPQKKKPQLQVVSLTKKPAAPAPPPEKSGICPWAKAEPQSACAQWRGDHADTSCSICLEDMANNYMVQKLECGHRFHNLCLKEWLDKNRNCPICRVHVLLPEDYPSLA